MSKVIILRGLPASGKSTWAKEFVRNNDGWIVVNKDQLRDMLHDGVFKGGVTEKVVLSTRDAIIRDALKNDINVIVDDTNFKAFHIKSIKKLAEGHDVEVKDFEADVYTCIQRDSNREKFVGENFIREMYSKFGLKKGFPPVPEVDVRESFRKYEPNDKPDAIIVDIDGTLALMNGRSPFDYQSVSTDLPNKPVIDVVDAYVAHNHDSGNQIQLIMVSGREDSCYHDTKNWLIENTLSFDPLHSPLYMRKSGDYRKDYIVKMEIFDEHIRDNYNVVAVFDDRKQVLDVWEEIGLFTFNVSQGKDF